MEIGVANLLNAQMTGRHIVRLLAIAPVVNEALDRLDDQLRRGDGELEFQDLEPGDVDRSPKEPETVGWWMYRAWCAVKSVRGVGVARTHKILHRLRPRLFPLIDGLTLPLLRHAGGSWAAVHHDLTSQSGRFESLESWFRGEIEDGSGDVPLGALRIHDVLLWMHARYRDGAEGEQHGRALGRGLN